ncbi:MAG: NAD(P)-dependent alcohol dehydrogenase [Amaricoccus sp.]|uniref:NAD(P)-dependent alcohol dehydrogenase n=1 Tax=Amaricoccus sp. TaxID=1872485 RepID=UPI003315AD5C
MKAAVCDRYGPPDVVVIREVPPIRPGPGDVLVRVGASSVTTGDWRMRSAAFPGITWLPGRLMFGIRKPRKGVLGGDFAGTVEAVGAGVTGFAPGDRVFGFSGLGAHAEAVAVKATGAIAPTPENLTDVEAAAVPFGALSALVFLRDFAKVRPGHRVLLIGASGGVGCYATQIARHLGATVDAVCGPDNRDLVQTLGADHVFDHTRDDMTATTRRYDVIMDIVGVSDFARCRPILTGTGVFVPLNFGSLGEIAQALWTARRAGQRMVLGTSGEKQQDLKEIADLLRSGAIRPVVDRILPFAEIADAHAYVEKRRRRGGVVLSMDALAA